MLLIALIPFVSFFVEVTCFDKSIKVAFSDLPVFSTIILPILLPLIWLGIFLNRNINLNKKLVEEYAYKEAISKTVTGLSEQIQHLDDDSSKKAFFENLLKLIISAGENNPAQYITHFDKSDNPLFDLLTKNKFESDKLDDNLFIKIISTVVEHILDNRNNTSQCSKDSNKKTSP